MHGMKRTIIPLLVLLCALCPAPWAADAKKDSRLMADAEYKAFLSEVEAKLPEWEAALRRIDPAKTNASYAVGKQITEYRDISLLQIGYLHQKVPKERLKHTVSGELALEGFLRGVFDSMDSVVAVESIGGITASNLEKYAPSVSAFIGRISNDLIARVELLEKDTCP